MGSNYINSIINSVVLKVIDLQGDVFYTKDISENPVMLNAHSGLINHLQYHSFVGKYLQNKLKDSNGNPLLIEIETGGERGSLWQLAEKANTKIIRNDINKTIKKNIQVVRKGHYETLDYMNSKDFMGIKNLYESYEEIGGVYFRPIHKNVSAVDLHPDSPKPRIGIGQNNYIEIGMTSEFLKSEMKKKIDYLKAKRAEISEVNFENKLEARIIREAQKNQLIMPGFPEYFRFVHSQWRIDNPENKTHSFTDITAVDLKTKTLVIIELKAKPDRTAFKQVSDYTTYFKENKEELIPFFNKLSKIMGKLYNCSELQTIELIDMADIGLVAWLNIGGQLEIQNLKEYEYSINIVKECKSVEVQEKFEDNIAQIEVGPQSSSDNAFKTRMRYHQSWYRANILKVPYGIGPKESDKTYYGNMLRKEDGVKGLNFLDPSIFKLALERISQQEGAVEPFRLLNNMLSSQPMCFNLFGMLADNLFIATKFWNSVFPNTIREITYVGFEYAPSPKEDFLNDSTAFDVYFEYLDFEGGKGFIGIECKYTEPFSQKVYDKKEYRRWVDKSNSPWKKDKFDELSDLRWNQLWRDHLLVISMLNQKERKFNNGILILIQHPEDTECENTVLGYSDLLLEDQKSFIDLPLDKLLSIWERTILEDDLKRWLLNFRSRYLV